MDVKSWLESAKKQIDALDAELIAMKVFAMGRDRSWLITHLDRRVSEEEYDFAQSLVCQRATGMPLAYVLGEKEFYGRNFLVEEHVLIPRPETEALIDLAKELDLPKRAKFLDVGTGSGCIAVTLALEFPQSYVLATDLSPLALEMAAENNMFLEGRVELVEADLLEGLSFDEEPEEFDVVTANLPYVDPKWSWLDKKTLAFEPRMALYARENGLWLYRRLFAELNVCHKTKELKIKYLIIEVDPCQHEALIKLAKRTGFEHDKTLGYGMRFKRVGNAK